MGKRSHGVESATKANKSYRAARSRAEREKGVFACGRRDKLLSGTALIRESWITFQKGKTLRERRRRARGVREKNPRLQLVTVTPTTADHGVRMRA